jgi:hypothetical protein
MGDEATQAGPGYMSARLPVAHRRFECEVPSMFIDKAEIVATLRSRGLGTRADWVDREMPELVDTYKHAGLLQTLGIDIASMPPATGHTDG